MQSDNPNSAVNWWYEVKDLPIPTPYTELVDVSEYQSARWLDDGVSDEVVNQVRNMLDYYFGYPAFVRTDLESGKHSYNNTCLITNKDEIGQHLYKLVSKHFLPMRPHDHSLAAFMVREYLNIESKFTAFRGLPIGLEVRHFVKDGSWEKGHYYWPKKSIRNANSNNWEQEIDEMVKESKEDLEKHKGMANLIAGAVSGDWSLDFARANNGVWYLIDMARYEDSYMAEEEELFF